MRFFFALMRKNAKNCETPPLMHTAVRNKKTVAVQVLEGNLHLKFSRVFAFTRTGSRFGSVRKTAFLCKATPFAFHVGRKIPSPYYHCMKQKSSLNFILYDENLTKTELNRTELNQPKCKNSTHEREHFWSKMKNTLHKFFL